jgi:hypothetical protein
MNTQSPPDTLEQQIDMALARLPEWQPPPDFSVRLAAAAARQAAEETATRAPAWLVWLVWLDEITTFVPTVLASAGLAAITGWVVPWSQLSTGTIVWTCVLAMCASGVVLALRILRTP